MLLELNIANILLMEDLCIKFNDGLTAITGQTGAGKSILLDSICIILGKRAETGILRHPEKQGILVATFKNTNKELHDILYNNGFISENDDIIIIKKIINKNGSKIFINDIQTTVRFVDGIAGSLLEIYSQFEQTDLFCSSKHLAILDSFGKFNDDIDVLKKMFHEMKESEKKYQETEAKIEEQKNDLEYLKSLIHDVEVLNIDDNEYDKLIEERKLAIDSEKIATYITNANSLFSGMQIGTVISKIQKNLQHADDVIDEGSDLKMSISSINELLDSIYNSSQIVEEFLTDLNSKHNLDENRMNKIEERISAIKDVARKYQIAPNDINMCYKSALSKLDKLSCSDKILKELSIELDERKKKYFDFANKLSSKRKSVAKNLEEIVVNKLAKLKMDKVVFFVSFENCDPTELGIDKVLFFASLNAGLSPLPINKIASGGELSRFMLAFKSAICDNSDTSTIIFDEIDTGVSGNVAFAIGKEMKYLSKHMQVICVTHNSQTAACAKDHFFVKKEQNNGDIAATVVKKLTKNERILAVAEMISGDKITKEALKNAEILLDEASKV